MERQEGLGSHCAYSCCQWVVVLFLLVMLIRCIRAFVCVGEGEGAAATHFIHFS